MKVSIRDRIKDRSRVEHAHQQTSIGIPESYDIDGRMRATAGEAYISNIVGNILVQLELYDGRGANVITSRVRSIVDSVDGQVVAV